MNGYLKRIGGLAVPGFGNEMMKQITKLGLILLMGGRERRSGIIQSHNGVGGDLSEHMARMER